MRSARTLLAGAAVAAALTVGAPLAYADGAADQGKNLTWQEKQDKAATSDGQKTWDEKQKGSSGTEESKGSEGKGSESKGSEGKGYEAKGEEKTPHGGVHTGGGGLALSGG
ncbi:hypothetical protein ACFC60_41505, partial [Kitasatospora purpeofusca]